MSLIADNLMRVRERIDAACGKARRPLSSVQLIAVSKLQPSSAIREAWEAGQRLFGENYAQELRDKGTELSDLRGIRWHAIGPLQTNKAKYVAKSAHAFHALDRLEIAQELSRRRTGDALQVFIEVNVADEETKSGVSAVRALELAQQIRALPQLDLVGVMALPPLGSERETRAHFARARTIAEQLGLRALSLGTTADFEWAIEEGATLVRVGTAIFGERPR